MEQIVSNAALPDTRPPEKRLQDYSASELVAAAVAPFQNPKPTELGATVYNQWYVGSCVPHGMWTQLEYEGIVPAGYRPSQLRSYRKRINYPQPGSQGVDMYDKIRAGQSNDFPTPAGFTEEQATAMPLVPGEKQVKDFKYFQYVDKDGNLTLDLVPADVAAGKAIAIFIYATNEEWSQEYVDIKDPNLDRGSAYVRHCVSIMPKGDFTENGKQWLAVHDSAKFGGRHLRYMTKDFFMRRAYFAAKVYATGDLPPAPAPEPDPAAKPMNPCQLGDRGDAVLALQSYLVYGKKLDPQYTTGYYGAITAKAVLWWQLEHWDRYTENVPKLLEWAGKYWGARSIEILNS